MHWYLAWRRRGTSLVRAAPRALGSGGRREQGSLAPDFDSAFDRSSKLALFSRKRSLSKLCPKTKKTNSVVCRIRRTWAHGPVGLCPRARCEFWQNRGPRPEGSRSRADRGRVWAARRACARRAEGHNGQALRLIPVLPHACAFCAPQRPAGLWRRYSTVLHRMYDARGAGPGPIRHSCALVRSSLPRPERAGAQARRRTLRTCVRAPRSGRKENSGVQRAHCGARHARRDSGGGGGGGEACLAGRSHDHEQRAARGTDRALGRLPVYLSVWPLAGGLVRRAGRGVRSFGAVRARRGDITRAPRLGILGRAGAFCEPCTTHDPQPTTHDPPTHRRPACVRSAAPLVKVSMSKQ